jgi:hypothetical protein
LWSTLSVEISRPNLKDCKRSEACLHSGYNRVELSRFAVTMGI